MSGSRAKGKTKKARSRPVRPRPEPPMRHPVKILSGAEAKRQLERVRAICLALPGATEKIAWGAPTFRAPKIFAMFEDHHHGVDHIALWCHAPKGSQEILVASEPQRFFRPPYVGPAGWVGVILPNIDDERLSSIVRDAYRMVAPKKLRASLED